MKLGIALLAVVFALALSMTPLYGQGRGQAKKPTAGAQHGGAKADRAKPATAKAPKVEKGAKTTQVAKTNDHAKAKKNAPTQVTTDASVKTSKKAPVSSTTTTTTTTVTEVTPTTPTTVHVKNPKLEARLLAKLPGVTDIQTASAGFKNWGQFVAAVHASERIGVSFETLKAKMTGITPATTPGGTPVQTAPMSLGQAVKSLKGTTTTTSPTGTTGTMTTTQIDAAVKAAEDAAAADLRQTRAN